MVQIDYDDEFDILYLRKEGEKVSFSIKLGNNILADVTKSHKIVGIEVFGASKFLKLSSKELKDIKAAKFGTIDKPSMYGVFYALSVGKLQIENELAVTPRPMPVLMSH